MAHDPGKRAGGKSGGEAPGEILIEFYAIGATMKVSAIDTNTLTEVSIVGPVNESREVLKAIAVRKLHYVMNKKNNV